MHALFSNRRLFSLTIILIISNLLITGISSYIIYNKSLATLKHTLIDIVERQESLVTVLHEQGKSEEDILRLINAMRQKYNGIGHEGEFTIGQLSGDSIHFLLSHKENFKIKFNNADGLGLPMQTAVQGKTGVMFSKDYSGMMVLAAYTYESSLHWGIVAKIPKSEVVGPYFQALFAAFIVSVLLLMLWVILFAKITKSILHRIIESEGKFKQMIVDMQVGVLLQGPQAEIVLSNPKALELLGITEDQLMGKTSFDPDWNVIHEDGSPFPGENHPVPQAITSRSPVMGVVMGVYRPTPADRVWLLVDAMPQLNIDGSVFHVICTFINISERKQAELLLKERNQEIIAQNEEYRQLNDQLNFAKDKIEKSELSYRLLINAIPDTSILLFDKDLRYQIAGGGEIEKSGFDKSSIEGKTLFEAYPKDVVDLFEPIYRNALSGINKTFEMEYAGFTYFQQVFPIFDVKGDIFAGITISQNITDRKYNQNLLQQKNEELIIAKEHAEESDRLKTAFLQNMSHEIRTPMNAIMGFSDLLPDQYENRPKLEHYSHIIHQRSADLLDLINEILDIAKIESGQLAVHPVDCDLNALFAELSGFFTENKKRQEKQHISLNIQAQSDTENLIIITDKVKLKQIFINLIGNAFKFTEMGEIRAGYRLNEKDEIIFFVSDTGMGIHPDKQKFVFERFAQLNQDSKPALGGTGLGLSIVKGLVDLLGGEICLESVPGKGTTFYFTIAYKLSEVQQNIPIPVISENELVFAGKSILIVEDDVYNAEYLKEVLTDSGFQIFHTFWGREAVAISLANTLDMVLMDISLPDMNGLDAVVQIKRHKPGMKIIAQTAYAAPEDRQRAFESGCNDYISKPLNKKSLLNIIGKNLR